jgi:hypothetical protein
MRKIAIGLSALLLTAAMSRPGAAQDGSAMVFPQHPACIWYEAVEFPGCVSYGTLSEEQARTARGHPQFVEPQAAAASQAQAPSATPVPPAHAARIVPSSRQ